MANLFLFCATLLTLCCSTAAQQWTSNPQPPLSLGEVASAIIGNDLYLVGEGSSSTCKFAIKPLGSSWNCNLAKRQHVGDHQAVVNPGDGTMWLVGGFGSDGKVPYRRAALQWRNDPYVPTSLISKFFFFCSSDFWVSPTWVDFFFQCAMGGA